MAQENAHFDANHVPTLQAVSSADGSTPINVYADPTTHRLLVATGFAAVATTFGTGGNTSTITDANVSATSFIVFMFASPPNGFWGVVPGSGSFVITSSDAENSTFAFSYKVIG